MPSVQIHGADESEVSNKAEVTLDEVFAQSDNVVAASARDFVTQEKRLYHDYYDDVREALRWADPRNDHTGMSDQEVATFLKEDRSLAPRIEAALDSENRGRRELTGELQELWATASSEDPDIVNGLLPIVVAAFGAGLTIPLGEYTSRYRLEAEERTEFLALLTKEAYRFRDLGRTDAHAREAGARIFAAIMEPDVKAVCCGWVGKDGRARLELRDQKRRYRLDTDDN